MTSDSETHTVRDGNSVIHIVFCSTLFNFTVKPPQSIVSHLTKNSDLKYFSARKLSIDISSY